MFGFRFKRRRYEAPAQPAEPRGEGVWSLSDLVSGRSEGSSAIERVTVWSGSGPRATLLHSSPRLTQRESEAVEDAELRDHGLPELLTPARIPAQPRRPSLSSAPRQDSFPTTH